MLLAHTCVRYRVRGRAGMLAPILAVPHACMHAHVSPWLTRALSHMHAWLTHARSPSCMHGSPALAVPHRLHERSCAPGQLAIAQGAPARQRAEREATHACSRARTRLVMPYRGSSWLIAFDPQLHSCTWMGAASGRVLQGAARMNAGGEGGERGKGSHPSAKTSMLCSTELHTHTHTHAHTHAQAVEAQARGTQLPGRQGGEAGTGALAGQGSRGANRQGRQGTCDLHARTQIYICAHTCRRTYMHTQQHT